MKKNNTFRPASVINFEKLMDARKEIERLKKQSNNYAKRIIKAIEYIEKHTNRLVEYLDVFEAQDLVNILQGVDKE